MADTYHAIKLYKTTPGSASSGKRVGINVTDSRDTTGYALYVGGSILATSSTSFVSSVSGYSWGTIQCRSRAGAGTYSGILYETLEENENVKSGEIGFQIPSKRTTYNTDGSISSESYYRSQIYFREWSSSGVGVINKYYETYFLPLCNLNLSENINYYILTTKSAVTIAQGGTSATTALGANDNLGSIYWSGGGTALTSGTNIDTGLTLGHTYYSAESTVTKTLEGTLPTTSSGFKIVYFRTYSSSYDKQFAWGTNVTPYLRTKTGSASTWGDWHTVAYIKANTTTGSTTIPVYVTSSGQLTPITSAIPVSLGGTGRATMSYKNAVLIGNSSTVTSAMQVVRTGSGAFFATAQDGVPKFGILPVAQGGTGLTSSPSILVNLGSTSATNVMAASPRPGVTGTLPIAHGGTGQTAVTTATSGVVTASSGYSISSQSIAKWGKIVTLKLTFRITTAVADEICFQGTIASGYRPAVTMLGMPAGDVTAELDTNGTIVLRIPSWGLPGGGGIYNASITYVTA